MGKLAHFTLVFALLVVAQTSRAYVDSLYIREVGVTDRTWGSVTDVAVQDSLVIIGTELTTLRVIRHSSDGEFTEIGYSPDTTLATAIVASGSFVFVADNQGSFIAFDITNPSRPINVDELVLDSVASEIVVQGNLAYLVCEKSGMYVIDVSNPYELREISRLEIERAADLAVQGSYAYVVARRNGIQVVDISNPEGLRVIATLGVVGDLDHVAISGHRAYVLSKWGSILTVDVSDVMNPVMLYEHISGGNDIVAIGSTAYVVHGEWLSVLTLSDFTVPTEVGRFEVRSSDQHLEVSENLAYVSLGEYGLQVVDVSIPEMLTESAMLDIPWYESEVIVTGDLVYVLDQQFGLRVLDYSNRIEPIQIGKVRSKGRLVAAAKDEDMMYCVSNDWGLATIDVSEPTAPKELSLLWVPFARDIAVEGGYAYLACGSRGLRIVDVADGRAPVEAGLFRTPGYAQSVAAHDNYVYLSVSDSLYILEVSNVATPSLVGTLTMKEEVCDIDVIGDLAFVACRRVGVTIYSTVNPGQPTFAGHFETWQDGCGNITITEDFIYVPSDWGSGFQIIDISDITNPTLTGFYDISGWRSAIAASGRFALVASGPELRVFDCSVAIGDESGRPQQFRLDPVYPNPFNSSTTISFDLPSASVVKLKIFNILGQEIVSLLDSEQPAGVNRIVWDGKNNAGQTVPSGVYLCQIKAANITETKKMVLLR